MKDLDFNAQFTRAYDLLENTAENVFITGKAGTGKSTLLEYFRSHTLKNIVVLAPTGVAAINVKGQTIHSFFCFKPDVTPDTVALIRVRQSRRRLYKCLKTIVIDEISMVRADLLDCMDIFLRLYGPDPEAPFGGVQMIFFGDLFQLPPVVRPQEQDLFYNKQDIPGAYRTPYFFSARVFESLDLRYIELKKVYRQKEACFLKLLNIVRHNRLREEHLRFLNQRYQPHVSYKDAEYYIHLTTTNAMADRINRQQLDRLAGEPEIFQGELSGDFSPRDLPTKQFLDLKEGAQVMLLNNDPSGRWVNGSLGKVVCLQGGMITRQAIEVELLETAEVVELKPFTWEMFHFYFDEKTQSLDSRSVGEFTQYPLRLAWAVTIHKSQGKTFSKVILDLGRGAFAHGQLYVALSRCVTLEGLILKRPVRKKDIILDEAVVHFMKERQQDASEA